jgi:hypothetical protein
MEIKTLVWILASAIAGLLYRLGGVGKPYDTKYRDLGVPLVGILLLWYLYPLYAGWKEYLAYFLTFGLYFGSMTTYWKKKGTDARWYNWLFTGLGYSLAFLPFSFFSGLWLGFVIRTIIVAVATTLWSEKIGNVVWEECGRGVITTITIPLLLI